MALILADRTAQALECVNTWMPGAHIERVWELGGGMSAHMLAIELVGPKGAKRKVIARFPGDYVRTLFTDAAAHEALVLDAVRTFQIPAPAPLSLGDAPDGHFLLLEYIEGEATANPTHPREFVDQIVGALASIHSTDLSSGRLDFLPHTHSRTTPRREGMNADLREPEVRAALVNAGEQELGTLVLRHGDFWPGNILWDEGTIVGIIDWENALLGPAIADLAISRLDIYWVLGRDAMEEFTARYVKLRPQSLSKLPYWDLRAAHRPMANLLDWVAPYASLGRPDMTSDHLRTVLLEFVEQALARLT